MQRLAWFSPVPPDRSGVARHSADLLPALGRDRVVDLFTTSDAAAPLAGAAGLFPAQDFMRQQRASPYDLIVYHLGVAPCHDDVWPCLLRHPGLVVLHDDNLHDARARMLLAQGRADDYRAEFAYSYPDAPAAVANLGASGLLGASVRLWPMRRIVLDAALALCSCTTPGSPHVSGRKLRRLRSMSWNRECPTCRATRTDAQRYGGGTACRTTRWCSPPPAS